MAHRNSVAPCAQPIAIRLGCRLSYFAEEASPILLLIQPRPEKQILITQDFISSSGMPVRQNIDSHGNRILRTVLVPGDNAFHHEAMVAVSGAPDNTGLSAHVPYVHTLPVAVLRYAFPSRYCESDKLQTLAAQLFGHLPRGEEQVRAVSDWVHRHIEYRYGTGNSQLSACDILHRGYGVCRDFAHVMIAFCRALDLPARYVAGHVPRLPQNETGDLNDMGVDFHAWCEVCLGKSWLTCDARYNMPLTGRVKLAHGMDAVDVAFATIYGNVTPTHFEAWSHPGAGEVCAEGLAHSPVTGRARIGIPADALAD